MQFTCIPLGASSLLKAFVICSTPPLEDAYADTLNIPMNDVIDPMFTIFPGLPSSNNFLANSWQVTKLALRFIAKTFGVVSDDLWIPVRTQYGSTHLVYVIVCEVFHSPSLIDACSVEENGRLHTSSPNINEAGP